MKLYKLIIPLILIALLSLWMRSCTSKGDNAGIEYAPQMYVSQAYEPYSQVKEAEYNPNGMTMRLPVEGTVARGQLNFIYPNPNTAEGYAAAASYTGQLPVTQENVAEGKRLYEYACWHCHGKSGKNDGPIFSSGKMPGPPWANFQSDYIKGIPMGQMFHSITYGRNLMGSHAHILSPEERWKVIYYIKSLSLGDAFAIEAAPDAEVEVMADAEVVAAETAVEEPIQDQAH